MRPSAAFSEKRNAVRELTAGFRVANPRVFGSVLQGTDQDGGDLDLVVDTIPGTTLFDLGGLQDALEELLGVPIDLVTLAIFLPAYGTRWSRRQSPFEGVPPG